jgi:hypothetical protein
MPRRAGVDDGADFGAVSAGSRLAGSDSMAGSGTA